MKNFNDLYVMNDERMIYKVTLQENHGWQVKYSLENENLIRVSLELVYGIDYISPDENDLQGYVGKENFMEEYYTETFSFYPIEESLKDALTDWNYKIIGSENDVKKIIGETNVSYALGLL